MTVNMFNILSNIHVKVVPWFIYFSLNSNIIINCALFEKLAALRSWKLVRVNLFIIIINILSKMHVKAVLWFI